ncbi:hypothetical protein ACPXCE_16670 [Streptomyces sp. DT24]|uniref:hypothetical protein n=1 Tax=Streptomyces sp. DT24 TaxID=3416520 RepID=UPI003CECF1A0
MELRDGEAVKAATEKASSRILETINPKGKTTESGARLIRCSDYPAKDEVYRARHPWSLYGVPAEDMKKAMDRLREQLPVKDWEIVKDGTDDSEAKSPQLVANSRDGEFSVDVRPQEERAYGDAPSLLEVTVVSACYRSE